MRLHFLKFKAGGEKFEVVGKSKNIRAGSAEQLFKGREPKGPGRGGKKRDVCDVIQHPVSKRGHHLHGAAHPVHSLAPMGAPDGEGKIPQMGPSSRCEWTPLPNLVLAAPVASTGMRNERFSFPTSTLVSACVLLII